MEHFGSWVASVTPFNQNGELDIGAMKALVDFHVENGTNTLFFIGSTGESNMLSADERKTIVTEMVKATKGRIRTFFGATFATTKDTIDFAQFAEANGADGLVFAAPAYTMPGQNMLKNFAIEAIQSVSIPCALYINPTRTAVKLEVSSLIDIADQCPNLVAIKEGMGDVAHMNEAFAAFKGKVDLVGVDALGCQNLFASLALGASGINNALGNVAPQEMALMARPWDDYNTMVECREKWAELLPLMKTLSMQVAPVCYKAAMRLMGLPAGYVRKPLLELSPEEETKLKNALISSGVYQKYAK